MQGEKTISSSLYKKHVNDLFNYGVGMGFSDQTCMDAIHDIFCALYSNEKKIDDIINIRHYLFVSLKNRLIDAYRNSQKINILDPAELPFVIEVSILDSIIADDERATLKANVEKLMEQLTDRQREAIYLRYMQELRYDEIAILLGMTPESVRKLVFRSIEKMRTHAKNDTKLLLLLLLIFPSQLG